MKALDFFLLASFIYLAPHMSRKSGATMGVIVDRGFFEMNPETHRHGCFNRKPFIKIVSSITGYVPEGTERPSWPNVMSMDCEYQKSELGKADKSCAGCKWRES